MVTGGITALRKLKPPPFKAGAKYRIIDPDGTIRDVEAVTSREVTDIQLAGGDVQFIPVEQQVKLPLEVTPEEQVRPLRQAKPPTRATRQPRGFEIPMGGVQFLEEPPQVELEEIGLTQLEPLTVEEVRLLDEEFQSLLEQFKASQDLEERQVISERISTIERQLRDVSLVEPTVEEGIARTNLESSLTILFPELLTIVEGEDITLEGKMEQAITSLSQMAQADPREFISQLGSRGRTPDVETIINTFFDVQPGDIDRLFEEIPTVRLTFEWWKIPHWFNLFFQPYGGEDLKGKAASSFIAGIGDVISTSGGAARWLGYEGAGSVLSAIGSPLQRVAPPDTSGEFRISDLLDPEFYATTIVRTIPFALSLAPLAIGGYAAGGTVASALGLGFVWRAIIGGLAGAVLSRPMESTLEAGATYDDAIARGKTEKEAKEEADEVFRNNLVLAGADAFQIAIALAPTPKWVPLRLVSGGLVRTARVGGKVMIVGLSEGGEEMYQDMVQRRARGEEWQLDPISKEVFAIGFIMGAGMGLGGDVLSGVMNKAQDKMSTPLKKRFDDIKLRFKEEGFTDEQAELRSLDEVMVTEEGDAVVREAVEEAKAELPVEEAEIERVVPPEVVPVEAVKPEVAPTPIVEPVVIPEVAPPEPVTPEEVVRPEPGAPEAGIQPSFIEGVPAEVIRPKGLGKDVQITMDDQLKLVQARQAAEEAPPEVREAYEAQAEIEGLKVTHETDPVATARFKLGGKNVGLDAFISIKEQDFPETFTVKQAEALFPGQDFSAYAQKGTPQYNKVPRDVALDELTKEFNMTPDEIANRVMAIRQEKRRIKDLDATIKTQMTETPLPEKAELTTEEVAENWNTIGQPKLTLKQAEALASVMGDYILSEDALTAYEVQRASRSRTKAERAEDFKVRLSDLIVSQGLGVEEAALQAAKETLSGQLPVFLTTFFKDISVEMRSAFFAVAYHNKKLQQYPYEMRSTITALTNALDGKPIPRERGRPSVGSATYILYGAEGASAWDRINLVFGKQPKVLKAIDKMAKEKKPLEDVVEGVFHEIGREPGPPLGLFEEPFPPELFSRTFGQEALPLFELLKRKPMPRRTKEQIAQDTLLLKLELARPPEPPTRPPRFDPPIDDAFKQPPMFNFMEQSTLNRVLKELLMAPLDIGNFLRANKASFDQSFLRQSKLLLSGHPILAWQAHVTAWQSMFSQKHTEAEWELITRDPDFQIYDQIRVDTGHDPLRVPAFAATKGTEQYRTSEEFGFTRQDVERAIPRFTAWLPHVKYSERGFSAGTNKVVWGVWKQKLAFARRYSEKIASGDVVLKEGEAFDIIQEMTDEQSMLGDLIQRANLRRFSGMAPAMNAFFFAARSKIGRFLLPKHLIGFTIRNKKVGFNPRVMKEAWKDFFLWNSYISGIMFLGAWLDLWDLEKDPRNAEFMSARIGKTRIDPWAGYRQFVVLYARLITGTGISSVTGSEYDVNKVGALNSFVKNSLSPLASILLEFWTGRNFLDQVIEFDDARYWIEKVTPFSINDIWEAAEEDWRLGIAVTIPAVYGEGVQTYTGDWEDNFTKLGLPKYVENTAYGLDEPYYDTADFWADTAKQFDTENLAELTAAKGFPDYIRAIVEAKISKEHLATLPSDTLVSLNADPSLDEPTFSEYREMWADRQKLVDDGDEAEFTVSELQPDGKYKDVTYKGEDAIVAFDKKNPGAEKGNFTQRQFSLLNQYWAITDSKEQAEFLEEHKAEIGVKPRDKWLRAHPKENAELAIWGQTKVLTQEAYDHFKTLAKKYDIPDNAIPELLLPPETSMDTHFDYEEMVSEGTHSSNEAKLLLLKDQIAADEAGVKSYVGWRNESNQPLQLPKETLEYYQLKVDNSQNYADLEEAQEADDEELVEEIRARKVDSETFLDVERRVEAMGKGTREVPIPDETVNTYVEHMRIGDETSPNSAESKLNRYDDPVLNDFLMNEDYWGKAKAQPLDKDKEYLDNYLVPRWRVDVKYRTEDEEYNALQTTQERQQYLLDNEAYRMDRRRREALTMTNAQTGDRFPLEQIESFVQYWEIDVKGKRQERFLVENLAFADAMHNIAGIDIPETQDVPAVQYDDIYDQYEDDFVQLEGLADNQSEHYIEFAEPGLTLDETRQEARDALRFDADGKYTEFGLAELERNAYGKLVPETLVSNYVSYYTIIGEGKPDNYEDVNNTTLWYDDDWFLMENPDFFNQVYRDLLENDKRDFSKIPTREVFSKYLEYLQIDSRQAKLRDDFRWDNLDLDDWLVLKFDYTPVTEKRRRAALTTGERLAESIEELERRLREHP